MSAWIGMNIFRGVIRMQKTTMYWAEQTRVPWMANVMTCPRFRNINAVWHITDPISEEKAKAAGKSLHWLFKLQPLIDSVRAACHAHWHCGQYVTVDELRVKFTGRHSATTHQPRKPIRTGFTVNMAACADSTYVYGFLPYPGKVDEKRVVGLAKKIVLELVWKLLQKGHVVVADNWFSSLPLVQSLHAAGTGYVGTLRRNVTGFPEEWCNVRKKKKGERGRKKMMKEGKHESYQSGNITMTAWGDRSTVLLVSTVDDPLTTTTVKRWDAKAEAHVDKSAPSVAKTYGGHMGGVDHANRMMHAYWPGTGSMRWWVALAWAFISIAIHNAYIIHSRLPHSKKLSNREFRLQLAKEFVGTFSGRKREVKDEGIRGGKHKLDHSGKKRECVRCRENRVRAETYYWCSACHIPLCVIGCYDAHRTE
jgi:hypothetical protein